MFPIAPADVQIVNTGVAKNVYEFTNLYTRDTEKALEQINAGLAIDAGNPILLVLQSATLQRLGKFDESMDSAEAASRLGPQGWTPPSFLKANRGLFKGDFDEAIQYYNQMIEAQPDHWYPYTMRGYAWLMKGNLERAKADIDTSLSLQPEQNWPYTWAVSIALRQGRLADVKQYVAEATTRFPDADAGEKAAEIIAVENINPFTPALSAFWSMNQGLFTKAIQKAERAVQIDPKFTDAYVIAGLSNCNLDKLPEAEAAYSQALALEPNYSLLYLLRAGARQGLGDLNGAMSDLGMVQTSPLAGQLKDYVLAAMQGKLSCKNALTYTP
jgi:tetratricopeptide (TPR) repeat protein